MKKTLTDLVRLFIVINLIVLAFHMLPTTAPARQQAAADSPHERNKSMLVVHEDTRQCLRPDRKFPWQQPSYQTTAYHLPH